MDIKQFLKSRNIQAALIAGGVSLIMATIGIIVSYSQGAETKRIAVEANQIAQKAYTVSSDIYKSKEIPRLKATPLSAKFYIPENPEAKGQVKINFSALIENLSEAIAREVSINFETEDWYGHKTSLYEIYKNSKRPIPHILTFPKNSSMLYPSYAPDAPSAGEQGFVSQDKPFRIKITVYWKDVNSKEYIYVGYYDLKYVILPNNEYQLYFQPIANYDSINDGDLAREYAIKKI